jgi:cell division protein FtsN
VRRSDIAFAGQASKVETARHSPHEEFPMTTTTKFIGLLAAVLLTFAEFLVFEYDAQQRVVRYQAENAVAASQRG